MIENLPLYIIIVFIITTLIIVRIFYDAVKRASFKSKTTNVIGFLLPFLIIFQATLAVTGFYRITDTTPPRLVLFAILPSLLGIISLFVFSKSLIERLPLKSLTFIHTIRIPIELVLLWLFYNGQIPQLMTFEGRNFDILIGISSPIITWYAFRNKTINRPLLIFWNILGLVFLLNIVAHAALSLPSNFQQFAFDQPNQAVLYFPFIWLPSVIVPIVLLAHLASLWQLFKYKNQS